MIGEFRDRNTLVSKCTNERGVGWLIIALKCGNDKYVHRMLDGKTGQVALQQLNRPVLTPVHDSPSCKHFHRPQYTPYTIPAETNRGHRQVVLRCITNRKSCSPVEL